MKKHLGPCIGSFMAVATLAAGCGDGGKSLNNAYDTRKVSGLEEIAKAGRFLVKMRPAGIQAAGRSQVASVVASLAKSTTEVDEVRQGLYAVKADDSADAAEVARQLGGKPDVEYVEPDHVLTEVVSFSDPGYSKQWAHAKIQSEQAWDLGTGSREIVVGVIDSGIDYTHPDLKDNMWKNPGEIPGNGKDDDGNGYVDDVYGWDFHNNDASPKSDDGTTFHGTHVAGTIGAVGGNGVGIVGHSPKVRLMALKFLGGNGSGYTSNAIKAIDYAIRKGARVLNNSWGGSSYSASLYEAIGRAKDAGILFTAAAGNSGAGYAIYPGGYNWSNILTVASSTSTDALSSFSNRNASTVDVAAPGSSIYSTKNDGAYATLSGTSMATPLVSGVAAMMFALRPQATYAQVKEAIMSTVDKSSAFSGKVKSGGRINAYKAMKAISALPAGGGGGGTSPEPGDADPAPGGGTEPLPQPGTQCDLPRA